MVEPRILVYAPSGDVDPLAGLSAELARRTAARITIAGPSRSCGAGARGPGATVERSGISPAAVIPVPGSEAGRRLTELVLQGAHDIVVARGSQASVVRELLRSCPCAVWIVR
jgi:hypothetical protein